MKTKQQLQFIILLVLPRNLFDTSDFTTSRLRNWSRLFNKRNSNQLAPSSGHTTPKVSDSTTKTSPLNSDYLNHDPKDGRTKQTIQTLTLRTPTGTSNNACNQTRVLMRNHETSNQAVIQRDTNLTKRDSTKHRVQVEHK